MREFESLRGRRAVEADIGLLRRVVAPVVLQPCGFDPRLPYHLEQFGVTPGGPYGDEVVFVHSPGEGYDIGCVGVGGGAVTEPVDTVVVDVNVFHVHVTLRAFHVMFPLREMSEWLPQVWGASCLTTPSRSLEQRQNPMMVSSQM